MSAPDILYLGAADIAALIDHRARTQGIGQMLPA